MNLPDTAIEYLDTFIGLYEGYEGIETRPLVHVYCFSKALEDLRGDCVNVKFFTIQKLLTWFF